MMITRGLPTTHEQMNWMLQVAIPLFIRGPVTAGLLMTGVVDGRAGLQARCNDTADPAASGV